MNKNMENNMENMNDIVLMNWDLESIVLLKRH